MASMRLSWSGSSVTVAGSAIGAGVTVAGTMTESSRGTVAWGTGAAAAKVATKKRVKRAVSLAIVW